MRAGSARGGADAKMAVVCIYSTVSEESPVIQAFVAGDLRVAVNAPGRGVVNLEAAFMFSAAGHGLQQLFRREESGCTMLFIGAPGDFAEIFGKDHVAHTGIGHGRGIDHRERIGLAFHRIGDLAVLGIGNLEPVLRRRFQAAEREAERIAAPAGMAGRNIEGYLEVRAGGVPEEFQPVGHFGIFRRGTAGRPAEDHG